MSKCGGCNETITVGKILTALEKKWHPDCFKCDDCAAPITGGSFSVKNDQPICSSCANQLTGSGDPGDDDGPSGKNCGKCDKPLTGVAVQGLTGGYWHPECFVCFDCGDVIDGSKGFIKDKDGMPLHGECAKRRGMGGASAGESCGSCGKELLGSCVTAMDKSYHKECFVCASCAGSISAGFLVVDNQPYCKACHGAGKATGGGSTDGGYGGDTTVTSGTTEIVTPAEKKGWLQKKDSGTSSKMAREMNKQANKSTGAYSGSYGSSDTDYQTSKPKAKAKPAPAKAKVLTKKDSAPPPAFCGECGTKSTGGRFCGECGFKFF